jgi:hypothetical protein
MTNATYTALQISILAACAKSFNYSTPEEEKADHAFIMDAVELAAMTGRSAASIKGCLSSLYKRELMIETEVNGEHGFEMTDEGIDAAFECLALDSGEEAEQAEEQAEEVNFAEMSMRDLARHFVNHENGAEEMSKHIAGKTKAAKAQTAPVALCKEYIAWAKRTA